MGMERAAAGGFGGSRKSNTLISLERVSPHAKKRGEKLASRNFCNLLMLSFVFLTYFSQIGNGRSVGCWLEWSSLWFALTRYGV